MTAGAVHSELAAGRWHAMTLVGQLANVGSEVERAIRAHEQANPERWAGAFARALELFDLTATDARWRGHRRREILRGRELFCGLFFGAPPAVADARFLRQYFLEFAVAARRQRA
ncbi:MAG: hypothetical protein ACHQSE_15345 [Gemmatimonadales bacterium]